MTNGEKIQHDFKCEVCEPIIEDNIIHVIFADKSDSAIGFDWDWWNAEYKEPTTKNDLGVDCIVDILGSYTDLDIPYKREIAENILTKLSSITPQESVLEKIREELLDNVCEVDTYKYNYLIPKNLIDRVIDKYKAESD